MRGELRKERGFEQTPVADRVLTTLHLFLPVLYVLQLSLIENRHSSDRAPTTPHQPQRKPNKPKPPLPHKRFQIIQPFHMRNPPLPANVMRHEIQFPFWSRRHSLHAEDFAPLVGEPVHGFRREAGEVVLPTGFGGGNARVVGEVEKDGVAGLDLLGGCS